MLCGCMHGFSVNRFVPFERLSQQNFNTPGRGEPRRPVLALPQFPALCVSEKPTTYAVKATTYAVKATTYAVKATLYAAKATTYAVTNFLSINIASFTRVSVIEV